MCPKTSEEPLETTISKVVWEDDHLAFARLVERHQSPVRLFLRRLTGQDTARADDLAQETFFKAYRYLASFRGEGRFLGWLFKIAYQEFAKDQRRHRTDLSLEEERVDHQCRANPQSSAQQQLESKLSIDQLLATLTSEERAAILMNYRYGLTHQEIADTMSIPLGTVKTHIRRGKEKLRRTDSGPNRRNES